MENENEENDTLENESEEESPKTSEGENPEGEEPKKSKEPEKAEESKELQSALAQKEHFREKFEKAQKDLEGLKGKPKTELPQAQSPMEIVRLAKALEGYNEEEVEFVTRNAAEKSIDSMIEATKDDWVKTGIQAKRDKVANESKTPEPSTKQTLSKKPVEKITPEEVSNMSVKEKEEYLKRLGWGK